MANKTIFQKLSNVMIGVSNGQYGQGGTRTVSTYNVTPSNDIIASFPTQEARDKNLKLIKQQQLLAYQWKKTGYDTMMEQMVGANQVKVMYRDADLMDAWPEIGEALDILSEEATVINSKGKILNINSKSDRVKSILEDLFVNRLDIHIMLPMIIRSLCKYGNEFMFLNIDHENGIMGWRQLPVHEMARLENGIQNMYSGVVSYTSQAVNLKSDDVKFVWEGHNESTPYRSWQVAHFRLIKDSLFLPYGCSILNKARRAWRMLSMMEDAMLLYRLERSIERRVFKVNVGSIDTEDVPAFLQEFANNIKRAPIIDPQTGQMDLRKNFLDVSADYFIPVRPGADPSSIEPLNAIQNQTSMDDIEYMKGKVLAAIKVPKSYLNFQEAEGKGQNLSLQDIRFCRSVNSIQQAALLELNKIAIIHLFLLGFQDDLTNFSLTLNNPSNQIETQQLTNLTSRLNAATTALQDQGGGIRLMSWHKVQKEIMGLTDSEISDLLNEIRLESAIGIELQRTSEIIKKTGLFNNVDRLYGEPGAKYSDNPPQQDQGGPLGGGGMGGGAPIPSMGGDLGGGFGDLDDLGAPDADSDGSVSGEEGSAPLDSMSENIHKTNGRQLLREQASKNMFFEAYMKRLNKEEECQKTRAELWNKSFLINEDINSTINMLEDKINNK